jgi:hypothetical protein
MTCLVSGFKTKKDLKAAVDSGFDPWIIDPSIFAPFEGHASEYLKSFKNYRTGFPVCLDHPRRTKFALIGLTADGKMKVS